MTIATGWVVMLILVHPASVPRDIAVNGRIFMSDVIPDQPRNGHETKDACEQWKASYLASRKLAEPYRYDPLDELIETEGALACAPVVEQQTYPELIR